MVRDGVLVAEPFSGLPTDIDASDLFSGLMDVAVHPEFTRNRLVYLTYTRALDRGQTVVLVRGRLEGMELASVEEIFVASLSGGDPNRPVYSAASGGALDGEHPALVGSEVAAEPLRPWQSPLAQALAGLDSTSVQSWAAA